MQQRKERQVTTRRTPFKTGVGVLVAAVAAMLLAACGGSGTSSNQPATAVQDGASSNVQVTYDNQSNCPVQLNNAQYTDWTEGAPQGQFDAGAQAQGTGYGNENYYEADFIFQGPPFVDSSTGINNYVLSFVNPSVGDPGFDIRPGSPSLWGVPAGSSIQSPMKEGQALQDDFQMYCLPEGQLVTSTTPQVNVSVTRNDDTSSFKVFTVAITNTAA
ncbi:MAG: hypothetical protein QOJ69_389 [Actinomycetota bacterium]|nr:hypothetical protein [Actinomycetota bacterium]